MRPSLGLMWLLTSCGVAPLEKPRSIPPTPLAVEGDNLAYVDHGKGRPVILVHGGFQDYRMWTPFISNMSRTHRVIAYSRRNHFPNRTNPSGLPDYAADDHARDLASLMRSLGFGNVDLVGHSSGASTVLVLAAQNPELVRSIIIVEPPLGSMLSNDPDDRAAVTEFMSRFGRALAALNENRTAEAVRLFADAVGGPGAYERRTPAQKAMMLDNIAAHAADARGTRPRPIFTCDMAGRVKAPVLLITGTRSPAFFHRIADRLTACFGNVQRLSIEASHTVPGENPRAFERAVLSFIE